MKNNPPKKQDLKRRNPEKKDPKKEKFSTQGIMDEVKNQRKGFLLFVLSVIAVLLLTGSAFLNRVKVLKQGSKILATEKNRKRQFLLEIRNGCGIKGQAERLRQPFIRAGYDVLDLENAEDFGFIHSMVVVLKPEAIEEGKNLADKLGVDMILQYESDSFYDLAFIVGADYNDIYEKFDRMGDLK
jgi:hypothetical protein